MTKHLIVITVMMHSVCVFVGGWFDMTPQQLHWDSDSHSFVTINGAMTLIHSASPVQIDGVYKAQPSSSNCWEELILNYKLWDSRICYFLKDLL